MIQASIEATPDDTALAPEYSFERGNDVPFWRGYYTSGVPST
jgi:hypothetical protein